MTGSEAIMTFKDGTQLTAAQYIEQMTVREDAICGLAAKFEQWSATLAYALPGLSEKLALVKDAAGTQEPGQIFLNGDPAHPVNGQVMGFLGMSQQLQDSLKNVAQALEDTANDPQHGLYLIASKYHDAEQANLTTMGLPVPAMPEQLAGKYAAGWQPGPDLPDTPEAEVAAQ
jgi:hypothetical protein